MTVQSSSAERARRPREPRPILPHAPDSLFTLVAVLPRGPAVPCAGELHLVAAVVADALVRSREGRDAPRALARRALEAELERTQPASVKPTWPWRRRVCRVLGKTSPEARNEGRKRPLPFSPRASTGSMVTLDPLLLHEKI
jgi:hypothetical protein